MPKGVAFGLASLTFAVIACGCSPVLRQPSAAASSPRAVSIDEEELSECMRPRGDELARERLDEPAKPRPALAELPPELRRVVEAARVEPLLATLLHPGDANDPVAIKLQLVMQLSSLEIQVASLLFEANCHGAQMDAVSRELDRRRRTRDVGLTVASILVGSVTSTAGALWEIQADGGAGPPALLISGGVASATLGLAAFIPDRHPIVFRHRPNLLTPIVRGEDPEQLYPSFVFRMLLAPDDEGTCIRDDILEDWQQLLADIPERERAVAESLLFGEGGIYDQRLLEVREQMFDILESHVHWIDQELDLLYRYSARLVEVEVEGD